MVEIELTKEIKIDGKVFNVDENTEALICALNKLYNVIEKSRRK